MVFTDAYERTLDAKNRIQIPRQLRAAMDPEVHGEAFFACPGEWPGTLSLHPERTFYLRAERLGADRISGEDPLIYEQLYYSLASRLEMDKQGRVVLPERQIALVNLGKEITLTGANTRIDIWPTAAYRAFVQTEFASKWTALQRFARQKLEEERRGRSEG